jgi:hypothetical protein
MILHIYELHAVLKGGYFVNYLVADFCGEKQSTFSITRKHSRSLLYRSREKIQSFRTEICGKILVGFLGNGVLLIEGSGI